MREVSVSRFVPAPPEEVERLLTPARLIEAEGSFTVRDTTERDGQTVVTAGRAGLELTFVFEAGERRLSYEQVRGPLAHLATTVSYEPDDEGTTLTLDSTVATGGPGIVDRVAAWKRKGELKRAIATLTREL
ncbi:SRPBCC family protein [Halosegnis longus]|uniref:SRPBCC family protein n=1 Tax=Halosegnis longus TaxID=2216012 RepID=UPI00096AAA2F|nr:MULTISPECIES: SRPBCC family protein [Halobacteriales]